MVITQILGDIFYGNIMRHPAIVTLAATNGIVSIIDAHVHGRVFFQVETAGPEYHHVHCHGAIVTGKAKQGYGAGCACLGIQIPAVIQLEGVGCRLVTVPTLDGALGNGVRIGLFRRDMAVYAGISVIRESHRGHGNHACPSVQAAEVMLGTQDRIIGSLYGVANNGFALTVIYPGDRDGNKQACEAQS